MAASYQQIGSDIDGEATRDLFGSSVSMSADGITFVAGAFGHNGSNGTDSGQVRVYKFNSAINTYAQVGLDIDGEAAGDRFGDSVSMSADGTTFVVGATRNDGMNSTSTGHVRVYSTGIVSTTTNPTNQPTKAPTKTPTKLPTKVPTKTPSKVPTKSPTKNPTTQQTKNPTTQPTKVPNGSPTKTPTKQPTKVPTKTPSKVPTKSPTNTAAPPENCGIFGWNLFCPRRGKMWFLEASIESRQLRLTVPVETNVHL